MLNNEETQKLLKEQFARQPEPIQRAIKSAALEEKMRHLAKDYNLLLDKWQILENQVTLTLLGFQEASELADNIEKEVEVPRETAVVLAGKIGQEIFEPIRKELEQQLQHDDSRITEAPDTPLADRATTDLSELEQQDIPSSPTNAETTTPSTQVTEAPTEATPTEEAPKVKRGSLLESYKSGTPSAERKVVEGDPYREPIE